MLGAGGVGRRVVAVAADAAEMTTARGRSHACLHAAPLSEPKNSFAEPHLRPSACGIERSMRTPHSAHIRDCRKDAKSLRYLKGF
jgi:hypothetical protein